MEMEMEMEINKETVKQLKDRISRMDLTLNALDSYEPENAVAQRRNMTLRASLKENSESSTFF